MKTHFKKLRNPNYIGSWDLMDADGKFINRIVTIIRIEKQEVFDGAGKSEQLPVAILKECKPLIVNAAVNMKAIAKALGSPFVEDWAGKRIELTVKKVRAFGATHDAIRVLETAPAAAPSLPELTPDSDKWQGVVEAMKQGYTIQQVKTKYTLSGETEQMLSEAVKVAKGGENV